jgi:hypothetical protein
MRSPDGFFRLPGVAQRSSRRTDLWLRAGELNVPFLVREQGEQNDDGDRHA